MADFVEPRAVRLLLSGGRFLDVKERLNAGEMRKVFGRMVKSMVPGEKIQIDPEQVGFTKLAAYIVGWSLTDTNGKAVPVSDAAINNLENDLYTEMIGAVDAHENEQDAKRDLEKNQDGGTSSVLISPSAAS